MIVVLVLVGITSPYLKKEVRENDDNVKSAFSVAKQGALTTVYRATSPGQQEKILEFEESVPANNSGNYWSGLPAGVDFSPDRRKIAYIDKNGLKVMDLESQQISSVVNRIGETNRWAPNLTGVVLIARPRWSSDGNYISFLTAYKEGSGLGVVDVQNGLVSSVNRTTREQRWSKEGHSILLLSSSAGCDYCEDRNTIWNPETGEETIISPQELARLEADYQVYGKKEVQEDVFSDKNSWITYRNDQYGFEIKYPQGYRVARVQREGVPQGDSIVLTNADQNTGHSSVWIHLPLEKYESSANPAAATLDDYSGEYQGVHLYTVVHAEERKTINNAEVSKQSYSSGRWEVDQAGVRTLSTSSEDEQNRWLRFVFRSSGGRFVILKSYLSSNYAEQDRYLLEEVAKTFKFVN